MANNGWQEVVARLMFSSLDGYVAGPNGRKEWGQFERSGPSQRLPRGKAISQVHGRSSPPLLIMEDGWVWPLTNVRTLPVALKGMGDLFSSVQYGRL